MRASSNPEDRLSSSCPLAELGRPNRGPHVLPPLEVEGRAKRKGSDAMLRAAEALAAGAHQLSLQLVEEGHVRTPIKRSQKHNNPWSEGPEKTEVEGEQRFLFAIERLVESMDKREVALHRTTTALFQGLPEELAAHRAAIREVWQEIQVLRRPLPSPSRPPTRCESRRLPRYRPHLGVDGDINEFPLVELSIKIYKVSNVNTSDMTFEADFVCRLDWYDPNVQGVMTEDLAGLDWSQYFNPLLFIDNSKDGASWMDGIDVVPRRKRPVSEPSVPGRGDQRSLGAWLRKTMRFRGTLAMGAADLRCFPFDLQALPIRVRAGRCQGLLLGTPAAGAATRETTGRVNLSDDGAMKFDERYLKLDACMRGHGHYAAIGAAEALQEFTLRGVTGHHPDKQRRDAYEVCIVVARPKLSSYVWDMIIQNLLVLLATTSFWDTSTDLSSRMSISLTVLLTLAAYTAARPQAIEKAPYVTAHDWNEQTSMIVTTAISLQSVASVVLCGQAKSDDEFKGNGAQCETGWCYSRGIDCSGFLFTLLIWLALLVYSSLWLLRTRRHATHALKMQLLSLAAAHKENDAKAMNEASGSQLRLRFTSALVSFFSCLQQSVPNAVVPVTPMDAASAHETFEVAPTATGFAGNSNLDTIAEVPHDQSNSADSADTSPNRGLSPKRQRPRPVELIELPHPSVMPMPAASPGSASVASPGARGRAPSRPSRVQASPASGWRRCNVLSIATPSPSPSPTASTILQAGAAERHSNFGSGLTLVPQSQGATIQQPFLP